MDREDGAREIAATGRVIRKHAPGWVWAMALIVAVICVVPLARALLATPGEVSSSEPPPAGSGLGTGVAIGFVGGVLVGFAIARVRRSGQ